MFANYVQDLVELETLKLKVKCAGIWDENDLLTIIIHTYIALGCIGLHWLDNKWWRSSEPEELFGFYLELGGHYLLHNVAQHWRTTYHKQTVVKTAFCHNLADLFLVNVANKSFPAFFDRPVNRVIALECAIFLFKVVQLWFDQDIIFCSVGKEKSKSGSIACLLRLSHVLDDLIEGCDSSSSSDHVDVIDFLLPEWAIPIIRYFLQFLDLHLWLA